MISFSGIFVKLADVSPTASGFYRVFFGAIFLLCATIWFKDFKKLTRPELFLIIFCGFVFALDLFFWHESIMYIGPGLATLLGNFSGIYFGLFTAVCYTAFLLSLRKIQSDKNHSQFSSLMIVSASCAVFLGLKMLYTGDSFTIPNAKSFSALLGLGLFSQTIGWVLIANAMPNIRASFAGLILLLQPALAFIWDVALFNRPTNILNWIGVIVTLAAIYMGLTGKARRT